MSMRCVSFARLMAVLCLCVCAQARASIPTLTECLEGADFIANAARARDNGVTRARFMAQLAADLVTIRAFPAELRWFVKDPDDEQFLATAARRVFDDPATPVDHRSDFLRACFDRVGV
jgi:hypothetical protein